MSTPDRSTPDRHVFETPCGVTIERQRNTGSPAALERMVDDLDRRRGLMLTSGYEYPGRYRKGGLGFVDPPIVLSARGRAFTVEALNARGLVLLPALHGLLAALPAIDRLAAGKGRIEGEVRASTERFPEEARSRQPSLFSVLRALLAGLACPDRHFGFYGAFGYDLVFQFEAIEQRLARDPHQRDLVLYLPDTLLVAEHEGEVVTYSYEFAYAGAASAGLARTGDERPRGVVGGTRTPPPEPGAYEASVVAAIESFRRGDLFEVVLSQTFAEESTKPPSAVFRDLRAANPAPYGALINLGEDEFLVAASPEMFVRVADGRLETCPISGTIARAGNAIDDAERIRTLMNSEKEEAELTMCTDVDRNDKYRVCDPASVEILGRRQIEMYSRVIHTVDHVAGQLAPGFDALDGFLSHAWAVTVTGAPKLWAMQFVEDNERSARCWYGGAFGRVSVDGSVDTGLTLRTIRMRGGCGEVRAGATLLYDSDPAAEDRECRLKASAMLAALRETSPRPAIHRPPADRAGMGFEVLLVDHEDSFVHTLGGYLRRAGARIETMRPDLARTRLAEGRVPDLLVLSPGPGTPADFDMSDTLDLAIAHDLPVFGVCLGLQGLVEYFGGSLYVLDRPWHGRRSSVRVRGGWLLAGLPETVRVGRYHSLCANRTTFPAALTVTAETTDGIVMAIEHATLPIAAVQFHPESLMTSPDEVGMPIITNLLAHLRARRLENARLIPGLARPVRAATGA